MKEFLGQVKVRLKTAVLDPQGKAVAQGLLSLGFANVADVRVGKLIEVKLKAANKEDAENALRQMGEKLLSNPVMEKFEVAVLEK